MSCGINLSLQTSSKRPPLPLLAADCCLGFGLVHGDRPASDVSKNVRVKNLQSCVSGAAEPDSLNSTWLGLACCKIV